MIDREIYALSNRFQVTYFYISKHKNKIVGNTGKKLTRLIYKELSINKLDNKLVFVNQI